VAAVIQNQKEGLGLQEAIQAAVDSGDLKEFPEDMAAFRAAVRAARTELKAHNKDVRESERAARRFTVIEGGRGGGRTAAGGRCPDAMRAADRLAA